MKDGEASRIIRRLKKLRHSDAEIGQALCLSERQVFRIRKKFKIGALRGARPEIARAKAVDYRMRLKYLSSREVDALYKSIGRRYNDDDVYETHKGPAVYIPLPEVSSYFGSSALACAQAL